MNNLFKYGFILLILTTMFQCRQDKIITSNKRNKLTSSEKVSFVLLVTDEENKILEGIEMYLGYDNTPYTSDKNGLISIVDVSVPKVGIKTTLFHTEYYNQIKLLKGETNSKNTLQIRMIRKKNHHVIETGQKGEIYGDNSLELPSFLLKDNGDTYTGKVNVLNHYFDPDDKNFLADAPGNMLALNEDNEYRLLGSLGMQMVELYSENGEALSIPSGEKATLTLNVAETQINNVPSSIPLWFFDESLGLWIREGTATLVGDQMVAEVSHFTTWNCDIPYVFSEATLLFRNAAGESLPNLTSSFSVNNFYFGQRKTDNEGYIYLSLALDEVITISTNMGGQSIQITLEGPFNEINNVIIVTIYEPLGKIMGNAVDCDNQSITNGVGYTKYMNGEYTLFTMEDNGDFITTTLIADQDITLVDIDLYLSNEISALSTDVVPQLLLDDQVLCDVNDLNKISGYVFFDSNEDDVIDSPLEGIEVNIALEGELGVTVTTNMDGYYVAKLIPGNYDISLVNLGDKKVISTGDLSIDDSTDLGAYSYSTGLVSTLEVDEHDADNNFILITKGFGEIRGSVMVDLDGDNVGDKSTQGIELFLNYVGEFIVSDNNGQLLYENAPNGTLWMGYSLPAAMVYVSDYDSTPDPDGDDSALGPNSFIDIKVAVGEIDADNNFVFSIDQSIIVTQVLIDTNGDGIGDEPAANQRVELYKRSSSGVPIAPNLCTACETNTFGNIVYTGIDPGEYVLYFIGSGDYGLQSGSDIIPDNNPINISGNNSFIPVDIIGLEYDDGNLFIVD